jgi:hypothetical protein
MFAAICATSVFLKCFTRLKIVSSKKITLASVKIKTSALACSANAFIIPDFPVLPGNSIK